MKTSTLLKGLVLGTAASFMVGCGPSKSTNETSLASSAVPASVLNSNKTLAYCSQAASTEGDIDATLTAYFDAYGTPNARYVRLKFRTMPAAFSSQNWDMRLYAYTGASATLTSVWGYPEKVTNGSLQVIDANKKYTWLNFTESQQIANASGVNSSSPQSIFNAIDLLIDLKDTSGALKVLRIYMIATDGSTARRVDILIPSFSADPAEYAADHSSALQALHPLKSEAGSGLTAAQYQSLSNAFCM